MSEHRPLAKLAVRREEMATGRPLQTHISAPNLDPLRGERTVDPVGGSATSEDAHEF